MFKERFCKTPLAAAVIAGFLALGSSQAMAQEKGNPTIKSDEGAGGQMQQSPTPEQSAAMQARLKVQELQQQLAEVRNAALENNPELQEQRDELQQQVMSRMSEAGVDAEKDLNRLREIANQLRSGEVDQQKRQSLTQEYQQTRQQLLEARQAALSDAEIQSSQEAFRDDLLAAMKQEEPEVEQLIAQYNEAQKDFQQKMQGAGVSGGKGS